MVFLEGLILDTKKRQYLTSKTNKLFDLKYSLSDKCRGIKKKGFLLIKVKSPQIGRASCRERV